MRTPSLRRRVLFSGVAVVALLLLVVDVFIYLTLRTQLEDVLDEVLAARAALVSELAPQYDADDIAARLQALGVPAVVTTRGGQSEHAEPATPRFGDGPPAPVGEVPYPRESRTVELANGAAVTVFATRAGIEATLRRVLTLLIIATAGALAMAIVAFQRVAASTMGPLDHVVAAAGRTAAGRPGERLAPDDPTTELGRMAVAYDRMLDSLEQAIGQARDAEERTRRFVDDAAHQLRTPLGALRSTVEALLQETDADVRDRLMANLVGEAARSNRLLTSLLTLARLDQGQAGDATPTDLAALCHDERARAASLAPHLTITCTVSASVRGIWQFDEHGTREVLSNLLDNARRHALERIEIRAELLAGEDGANTLAVLVSDDGPGVPSDAQKVIFERFASLDGHGGSGLGLPIARELARAQGGDLTHREGTFVLQLPARA